MTPLNVLRNLVNKFFFSKVIVNLLKYQHYYHKRLKLMNVLTTNLGNFNMVADIERDILTVAGEEQLRSSG